jgi:hypothetical protein
VIVMPRNRLNLASCQGIVVDLPFLSRPVCLPVLARLWHLKGTGAETAEIVCI